MVKQMNMDITSLFKEYDTSGDGLIEGMEFIDMMKGYDNSLTEQEL